MPPTRLIADSHSPMVSVALGADIGRCDLLVLALFCSTYRREYAPVVSEQFFTN